MRRRAARFSVILIGALLVISMVAGAAGVYTVRQSYPQTQGEIPLAGLKAPVEIFRDAYGIPHIYATNEADLFFAQGYVHAQDRFWQMDFWRHIGAARLSEMFGESQLESDRFLRTLGWARVAQQEWEAFDPGLRAIMEQYSAGVNAYLAEHSGPELSLEYAVLGLLSPDYKPEPWTPLNTLTWAKVMAWDLGGNMDAEIEHAILLKTLSPEQLADIDPTYPTDHPYIVPNFIVSGAAQAPAGEGGTAAQTEAIRAALLDAGRRVDLLETVIGPRSMDVGSNSWVIGGKLTSTGMPLLANDPHLSIQMPSIWYEIGLHCRPKTPDCALDVAGFSFAGAPGVVIGHNDRIAWGFTNVEPDTQDLYIEKINPQNPNQYEVNGKWVDMTLVEEILNVAGGEAEKLTVRYTRHGPLITETYGDLDTLTETSALALPPQYAIALRWTALEPGNTFQSILMMNRAQSWEQFREAASYFVVPSQNLVYADTRGNIGYQMPGRVPRRANGDGKLPVPGWTDEYEWKDYIPFDELPNAYNPDAGYIVTANNAVAGPDYPYLITSSFDLGYRAQRIVDMIEAAPGPIDAAYIQTMHGDNMDLSAEFILPVLKTIEFDDERTRQGRDLLTNWDLQMHMDSAPAALYAVLWRHLLADTFHDELPEDYWPGGNSRWFEVMRRLVDQPESAWWDVVDTPTVEDRDQIFAQALQQAVAEMRTLQGSNMTRWNWGDLHEATFRNGSLGESGVAPIEALFNRGPFRTSGGSAIVNATGWRTYESYAVRTVPSMRMIVDLGKLENSQTIHTTGQSGHAYHPNYIDMADLWRTIQYHPMIWTLEQAEAQAQGRLKLFPR